MPIITVENKLPVYRELYIILSFYYKNPYHLYINNHEILFILITDWIISAHSQNDILAQIGHYPITTYPDACICGNTYSSYGSLLRTHCHKCIGRNPNKGYFTDYIFNKIAALIHPDANIYQLHKILCEVIYNDTINRRNRDRP